MSQREKVIAVLNEYLSFDEGEEPEALINSLCALFEEVSKAQVGAAGDSNPKAKAKAKGKSKSDGAKKTPNNYSLFVKHVSAMKKGNDSSVSSVEITLDKDNLSQKVIEKLDGHSFLDDVTKISIGDLVTLLLSQDGAEWTSNLMKLASLAWNIIPASAKEGLGLQMSV